MTDRTPIQELVASARQLASEMAAELAADPLAASAMSRAAAGAELAASATRKLVGRDAEVLDEVTRAIDELVEVVLVQQELLESLMRRVASLETAAAGRPT
ncbi:MAG TPA: hypothetical protein VFK41_11870 [Nocardioidaceae bacterium]|nr:hypothetical protein [Nocardioidaceae bacterium]